jgi:hypothetical protein
MSDAEQPRPQSKVSIGRAQPGVCAHEHILEGVLSILSPRQHLPGVSEQSLVVAVVDYAERLFVPGAEESHQLFIRAKPQQWRTDRKPRRRQRCGRMKRRRFHSNPFDRANGRGRQKLLLTALGTKTPSCA